jgi:predicted dehydrogenase
MIIDKSHETNRNTGMGEDGGVLRVGMIGAGWVTQYHLPGWQKQAHRARVTAIADPSLDTARAKAAAFGIDNVYQSAEAMLAEEQPDIVDICAPRDAHVEMVRLAAAAGCAIVCQKPLAPTLAEARALVSGLPAGVRLMVHENWRFRASYRRLKQWLEAGYAGDVRQVRLDLLSSGMIADLHGHRPALVRQPFMRRLPRMLVSEVLIHHLDTLRFLLGELELVAATLERTNEEIIGEDVASLLLRRSAGGAPVAVTANFAVHGAPALPRDQLSIYGDRSTITLDGHRLTATGAYEAMEDFDPDTTYQGAYDRTIAHFLDALQQGTPFETAPADNLKTLELVEAIYERGVFRT